MNFSDMISELKTYKNNLVSILVGKGIAAEENEGFSTLIPKVEQIETGSNDDFDGFLTNTLSEFYNPRITSIVVSPGGNMQIVNLPAVTSIPNNFCGYNTVLKTVIMPSLKRIGVSCFTTMTHVETLQFDLVESIGNNSLTGIDDVFNCNETCKKIDLPCLTTIGNGAFKGFASLEALILRSQVMVTGGYTGGTLANSSIANGTGYVYVPSALVETYKADTAFWGTFAEQIRALEDYTVDGTITGELDSQKSN